MTIATTEAHLECDPNIAFGKPRIIGHRITVHDIAAWHRYHHMSVEDIVEGYDLKPAEVHAALTYYFDHQDEIDRKLEEEEEFANKQRAEAPSILRDKLRRLGIDEPKD